MSEAPELICLPEPQSVCALPIVSRNAVDWDGFYFEHHAVQTGEYPEITHPEIVLVLTLDRTWHLTLPHQTELQFSPGDIFLAPAQAPHGARFDVTAEQVVMLLNPIKLQQIAEQLLPSGSIALNERYRIRDPLLQQLMLALHKEVQTGQRNGLLYADAMTHALAVHLLTTYSTSNQPLQTIGSRLSQQKLRRAIEYIHDNLEQNLFVAEIAAATDINPYYFARLFKDAIGMAPHQYLQKQRIERAKVLLAATDLPIAEIGYRLGFSSQSHFSATFHRLAAMTPSEYRKAR